MALRTNAVMKFESFETIPAPQFPGSGQDTGITVSMLFSCADPGPNMPSTYAIVLTSGEIATINGGADANAKRALLISTITDHLTKQFRPASAITAVLTGFVGQTLTV